MCGVCYLALNTPLATLGASDEPEKDNHRVGQGNVGRSRLRVLGWRKQCSCTDAQPLSKAVNLEVR